MVVLCLAFVLLGLTVVWGLKAVTMTEENGDGGGVMAEASLFPLKLTMILNRTTFKVNETVKMTLLVENIGNETLPFKYGSDEFSFVVYDRYGSQVYRASYAYLAQIIPLPLPPGLSQSHTLTWYQDYDPIFRDFDQDPLYEYRKVPPGMYQIVGLFESHTIHLTIETPPLRVTIGL
jgi:hypothetical protein